MSSQSGDSLRIPIEIKTEDLDEIRELINDISRAQSDLQNLKAVPQKGRGSGDQSSRSAYANPTDTGGNGIFGGSDFGDALPSSGRDKTSKAPVQKENQFAKLEQKVNEVEQNQQDAIKGALGTATQGVGFASIIGKQGAGGLAGLIHSSASRAFIPLAVITTIVEIAHSVVETLLKPGGLWDIRFKRNVKEEVASASERSLKAQISQGLKVIRVTSYSGQRAQALAGTMDAHKAGLPIYDMNMELRGKGII